MKQNLFFFLLIGALPFLSLAQTPPCGAGVTVNMAQTNVSCFGGNNGAATATVVGGTGNYLYTWTPSNAATASISNLTAGTYSVVIANITSGGNPVTVYTENFDGAQTWTLNTPTGANDPDANYFTIGAGEGGVLPPGCGVANNGNNTLHVTSTLNPTGGASYNAGGLCAFGICVQTNVRAESPNISTVGNSGLTLSFDYIGNGQGLTDNASLVYSTDGGTTWTTLATSLKSTICASGQGQWTAASYPLPASCNNIPNLRVGFVWVNNDDGAGTDPSFAVNNVQIASGGGASTCYVTGSVTITQPTALAVGSTVTAPSCSGQNNGSITLFVNGGTSPYSYSWNTGSTNSSINNLAPGSYSCTITDNNGCSTVITPTVPQGSALIPVLSPTPITCFGANNGSITATANGTPPFTYSWSTGAATSQISNLGAGIYSCTIQDATGCTGTSTTTLQNPTAIQITLTPTNVTCNGLSNGQITAAATGGAAPLTYSWSNGLTGQTLSNLSAGTYTCYVKDNQNCMVSQVATITQPSLLAVNTNTTNSVGTSNNGTATATPSGGTPPYTYTWNTTPPQYTQTATSLAPGAYTCTVKDANGCTKQVSVNIESINGIYAEMLEISDYKLFPIPAQSEVQLQFSLAYPQEVTISIWNINGQEIWKKDYESGSSFSESIPLYNVSSGLYLLKIATDKGYGLEKLWVE